MGPVQGLSPTLKSAVILTFKDDEVLLCVKAQVSPTGEVTAREEIGPLTRFNSAPFRSLSAKDVSSDHPAISKAGCSQVRERTSIFLQTK